MEAVVTNHLQTKDTHVKTELEELIEPTLNLEQNKSEQKTQVGEDLNEKAVSMKDLVGKMEKDMADMLLPLPPEKEKIPFLMKIPLENNFLFIFLTFVDMFIFYLVFLIPVGIVAWYLHSYWIFKLFFFLFPIYVLIITILDESTPIGLVKSIINVRKRYNYESPQVKFKKENDSKIEQFFDSEQFHNGEIPFHASEYSKWEFDVIRTTIAEVESPTTNE